MVLAPAMRKIYIPWAERIGDFRGVNKRRIETGASPEIERIVPGVMAAILGLIAGRGLFDNSTNLPWIPYVCELSINIPRHTTATESRSP
ncbi:MAG: hypothetical protein GVY08_05320 [Bacteroidetes bacterium]|jgi:hypothetical protein|nr:hypothetical protein [Bacteroidota bacterium]